jgi:Flp pilus assembly CpaF family ATPase
MSVKETLSSQILRISYTSARQRGRTSEGSWPESEIPVADGSWFAIGHTEDCEIVVKAFSQGTVIGRVLVARPFLLLDLDDVLSLHCQSVSFEHEGFAIQLALKPCEPDHIVAESSDIDALQEFIRSKFFHRLDEHLRTPAAVGALGWRQKTLFLENAQPSEDLVLACEQAVRAEEITDGNQLRLLLQRAIKFHYFSVSGFGLLEPLLMTPGLREILVNSYDEVFVESSAGMERSVTVFPNHSALNRLVETLLGHLGARLDPSQPIAQGVLRGRYRVHILSAGICARGPCLSIRCFPEHTFRLKELIGPRGKVQGLEEYLIQAVRGRKNILVCGETSSGKTSLLEALSAFVPDSERIVVAEDVRELRLENAHKVYLETRAGFGSHVAEIDLRSLVRESLRMRPDRLIIGECRGAEALDLLQALNTGHEGSMTSIHGSSPRSALKRLETLSMFGNARITRSTAAALIATGIDTVIEMGRDRSGCRSVRSVVRVVACPVNAESGLEYILESDFVEGER